jgi:hypothetical protein
MLKKLYNEFNQNQEVSKAINKALTSAVNVGEGLIPESLEKVITDTVIKLSPQLSLMTPVSIESDSHKFNQLTKRPARGGAMGENATTPVTQSGTSRQSHDLKIIRRKGKITNFLKDASRGYIDSAAYELENHIQTQILDLVFYMMYGNEYSNTYEYNGLEQLIPASNRQEAVGTVTNLDLLDEMIDASNRNGGSTHSRGFYMSPEMLSKFSRLLTNVRNHQSDGRGFYELNIPGGWRLWAYRDIPIIETTFCNPIETMLASTITLTTASTGGALSDATYYIQVAPVTYEGEQAASTEKSIALSGGTSTQIVKIALSAVHKNAEGVENPLSYKIYASTSGGANNVLVAEVPAFLYDSEGSITGDNGVGAGNEIIITTLTPTTSTGVPTQAVGSKPLTISSGVPEEVVALHDFNPIQGLGKMPYTNTGGSRMKGLITLNDLAETDDFINFLVKSYTGLTPAFAKTSYWARGVKRA